jgi:hypothetical protein
MSEMSSDQINKNFVAMNSWMKLERQERDALNDMVVKMQATLAQVQQDNALLRQQMNLLLVETKGTGPTKVA